MLHCYPCRSGYASREEEVRQMSQVDQERAAGSVTNASQARPLLLQVLDVHAMVELLADFVFHAVSEVEECQVLGQVPMGLALAQVPLPYRTCLPWSLCRCA